MDELKKLIETLKQTFEQFKTANDERLAEIERKGHADPLLEEKVNRLSEELDSLSAVKERLDQMETRLNRPGFSAESSEKDQVKEEHRKAFDDFMRKGKVDGLRDLEKRALNLKSLDTITPADGGYAVPEVIDTDILALMQDISPIRQVANVITVSTSDWKKLVNLHGAASGWVGETEARPETDTPQLAQVEAVMGEIYANPAATQTMLEDVFFDAERWLSDEVATEFAQEEAAAFVNGNGTNKPKGFLSYTNSESGDGVRAFGQLQFIKTGVDGAFKTFDAASQVNPVDDLVDMTTALKAKHRAFAVWMMNRLTLGTIRKFKDADGNYIWQPSMQAGQPQTILGYRFVEAEDMPDIGSGTYPIAFGNFKAGYTIIDRMGTRVLRDPYTNKPYVHFYTTKRVGGQVVDSEAIKLLKMSA